MIEDKVIAQNTLKAVKRQRDHMSTVDKQICFAPATRAEHLSNFLVFI